MFAVRRQESIRILLIEEEILVRAALSQLVTSFGFEIVGEAGSAQQAATELSRIKPDVVLLSLNGSEHIDLKLARDVAAMCGRARLLILASTMNESFQSELAGVGANRIALKNEDPKKLEKAIREIGKLRRRIRTSR